MAGNNLPVTGPEAAQAAAGLTAKRERKARKEAVKAFVADKSELCNLTKGQQAMRLALLYPEAKRGRGNKDEVRQQLKGAETASFRRVQEARQVVAYSHPVALAVRDGVKTLDDALECSAGYIRNARRGVLRSGVKVQ
jgi:hypothetical protein